MRAIGKKYTKRSRYIERLKQLRHQWDFSDVARHIYRNRDCIQDSIAHVYVDEAQDLCPTDMALLSLICSNPNGFYFAGDTAQSISCSSFRFEDLKALFYTEFLPRFKSFSKSKLKVPPVHCLTQNFRTHTGIIQLASYVVGLICNYFPTLIDKLNPEVALDDGPLPKYVAGNLSTFFSRVFGAQEGDSSGKEIGLGASQVIIVRDLEDKLHLEDILPNYNIKDTPIFTAFESKGLEFEDVVLFNFLSRSPYKSWEKLLKPQALDVKTNAALANELKMFYVAVTRSKSHLWLYEESPDHSFIGMLLDNGMVKSANSADIFAHDTSTEEDWRVQGRKYFEKRQFEEARKAFKRGNDSDFIDLCDANILLKQGEVNIFKNEREGKLLFERAATLFEMRGDVKSAAKAFARAGNFSRAASNYLSANLWDDALASAWESENVDCLENTLAKVKLALDKVISPDWTTFDNCCFAATTKFLQSNVSDDCVRKISAFLKLDDQRRLFNRYRKSLLIELNYETGAGHLNSRIYEEMFEFSKAVDGYTFKGDLMGIHRCHVYRFIPYLFRIFASSSLEEVQTEILFQKESALWNGTLFENCFALLSNSDVSVDNHEQSARSGLRINSHIQNLFDSCRLLYQFLTLMEFEQTNVEGTSKEPWQVAVRRVDAIIPVSLAIIKVISNMICDVPSLSTKTSSLSALIGFKNLADKCYISPVASEILRIRMSETCGELHEVNVGDLRTALTNLLDFSLHDVIDRFYTIVCDLVVPLQENPLYNAEQIPRFQSELRTLLKVDEVFEDLCSRTKGLKLKPLLGWYQKLFPTCALGVDYKLLWDYQHCTQAKRAYRSCMLPFEGNEYLHLLLIGYTDDLPFKSKVPIFGELYFAMVTCFSEMAAPGDALDATKLLQGIYRASTFFLSFWKSDKCKIHVCDFFLLLEKFTVLVLLLYRRCGGVILTERLLSQIQHASPVLMHGFWSKGNNIKQASDILRNTLVPTVARFLLGKLPICKNIRNLHLDVKKHLQSRAAILLLILHFNLSHIQEFNLDINWGLANSVRNPDRIQHGIISVFPEDLEFREYHRHLQSIERANEIFIICTNSEHDGTRNHRYYQSFEHTPRIQLVNIIRSSHGQDNYQNLNVRECKAYEVNMYALLGPDYKRRSPIEISPLAADQDESEVTEGPGEINEEKILLQVEQAKQEFKSKFCGIIAKKMSLWLAKARLFISLQTPVSLHDGDLGSIKNLIKLETFLVRRECRAEVRFAEARYTHFLAPILKK
jgi:tetratricopeptide (TPR) repeat protein